MLADGDLARAYLPALFPASQGYSVAIGPALHSVCLNSFALCTQAVSLHVFQQQLAVYFC